MNKHFNIVDQISVATGEVYRTSENFIVFKPATNLTTQSVEEMHEMGFAVEKLSNGKKLPYITDISNALKFNAEEKNLAKQKLKMFSSAAFVTSKSVSKVMLSIFLMFYREDPAVKVFSKMEEAKKWSLQFNDKNNELE